MPILIASALTNGDPARWPSAFFELVVARTLQDLGAALAIEVPSQDGKRPDFRAQFVDMTITVEAVSPVINGHAWEVMKMRAALLDIVEALVPDGWMIEIWQLPVIGPNAPKTWFRRAVEQLLADVPPPTEDANELELHMETESGAIKLLVRPRREGWAAVVAEPVVAFFDDTEARIRHAVNQKRAQVRNAGCPVLLAVRGGSGWSDSLDGFDQALFGRTTETFDERRRSVGHGFYRNGEFLRRRQGDRPTFAGVLAFHDVGSTRWAAPVLYRHPRYDGHLPEALLMLEQRTFEERTNSIKIEPPRGDRHPTTAPPR